MIQLSMKVKQSKGISFLTGITADQIKGLLEQRHNKDIFFTECKNGATWSATHLLKLDAWAMKKSYSPLATTGYEIKVDRNDFENDQKWIDYLPLCHLFFFVCPAGMIRSDELPSKVGLMWVSTTGKLHVKRYAERRTPDAEKMNALLIYILMSRMEQQIQPEPELFSYRRKHIEECKAKKELSYLVKGHIRQIYEECKEKDTELFRREQRVKQFAEDLKKLGITWDSNNHEWQDSNRVQNEIRMLKNQLDNDTIWRMRSTGKQMVELAERIDGLRKDGLDKPQPEDGDEAKHDLLSGD